MKRTIILILILTSSIYGQTRNSRTEAIVPAPTSTGTVTLSLAEYNRLTELAARKPKSDESAPLPFVLSTAAFKLRVEDQSLTGVVDIAGSVLEKGSVKVPLTSGLTILEAQQANNPLPLLLDGTTQTAILTGPAPFAVSLSVASPLTVEAGRASFTIPVPVASASLLTLDLPGNHANVRIEPGLVTSRTTLNGHTIVEATLEPGKPARVWWTTREIAAPVAQREVRFLSDIKSVVSVGDSQMRITALCDVTVIQGEAGEFRMPLPAGFELTEATGPTLDSFANDKGVLVLNVREPVRRNHQFLIALERANKETKVEAPVLALSGVTLPSGPVSELKKLHAEWRSLWQSQNVTHTDQAARATWNSSFGTLPSASIRRNGRCAAIGRPASQAITKPKPRAAANARLAAGCTLQAGLTYMARSPVRGTTGD